MRAWTSRRTCPSSASTTTRWPPAPGPRSPPSARTPTRKAEPRRPRWLPRSSAPRRIRAAGAGTSCCPPNSSSAKALHDAAADGRVTGLIAKVGGALPWAAMQELRIGVRAFAASGKPTLAWAETFGEGTGDMAAYVLATGFDEIWLQPGGGLGLLGVGVETTC